jgi:8-oxo-dGTP pyrophosphatase MutT (NUDIX family)
MESDDYPTYHLKNGGRNTTYTLIGDANVVLSRVYAHAYTPEGTMLLVGDAPGGHAYRLPGGGVEEGESAEEALVRELQEEAAATVEKMELLGIERMDDDSGTTEHRGYYWCRITPQYGQYTPQHEIALLKLVDPSEFLDAPMRRRNRVAELLLARSLAVERKYRESRDAQRT